MKHFAGYTASAGNIYGYWRDESSGIDSYGEHREYKVSFRGHDRLTLLQEFLASIGAELEEQSIYMEYGEDAWLIKTSIKQDNTGVKL